MIKRRNPHVKAECENCTLAGRLQANCGWCNHFDYAYFGSYEVLDRFKVCKLDVCQFSPLAEWRTCFQVCGVNGGNRE